MTLILLIASILLGITSLGWGYFAVGLPWIGAGIVLLGLIWLVAIRRGWYWYAYLGMTILGLGAGLGVLLVLPIPLMLTGLVCGLVAWDLSAFHQQLPFVEKEDRNQMEGSHLGRLGMFVGLSLAISAGSLFLRSRLTFEWVALLVLLGVWGTSLMVKWLRKPEK